MDPSTNPGTWSQVTGPEGFDEMIQAACDQDAAVRAFVLNGCRYGSYSVRRPWFDERMQGGVVFLSVYSLTRQGGSDETAGC